MSPSEKSTLVLTDPKPLKRDDRCPRCRAAADKRVKSGGFGQLHDVCSVCGHDFEEDTRG